MKEMFLDLGQKDESAKYGYKEYQVEIVKFKDKIDIEIDGYLNCDGEKVVISLVFDDGPKVWIFNNLNEQPKELDFEMAQECFKRTITDEEVKNLPINSYVYVPCWVGENFIDKFNPVTAHLIKNDKDGILVQRNGMTCKLKSSEIYGIKKDAN